MSYLSLKPIFPQDVERYIFELAAGMDVKTAMALVVLSKVVNVWIETFFYRNITLLPANRGGAQLEKLMTSLGLFNPNSDSDSKSKSKTKTKTKPKTNSPTTKKPADFLATHVKVLYISAGFSNRDLLVEFLMKCGRSLEHFANYRLTHDVGSKKRGELIRDLIGGVPGGGADGEVALRRFSGQRCSRTLLIYSLRILGRFGLRGIGSCLLKMRS
ncbi:hypothetical protein BDN72DRAFT_410377 [Pluteus cervinus]|uniref:Uncharacterized protein n=1 Tax=Pluteus cervinus TaxID=181527 RepID=A0ACD3B1S8_9AGAR|nr:hypothetical protein BDN72DRAFT_410377 [Pluteus cervinus]